MGGCGGTDPPKGPRRTKNTAQWINLLCIVNFGDRYDWTTGAPHDGKEWKKYRVVPHVHPSRILLYVYFNRSGSKEPFSFPGATWDRFRCTVTVEPRPVIFGVENLLSHSDLLSQRTLCGHHSLGNCRHFFSPRRVHSVVNLGGVVKTLRRSSSLSRSVFSTAGSFGHVWRLSIGARFWCAKYLILGPRCCNKPVLTPRTTSSRS